VLEVKGPTPLATTGRPGPVNPAIRHARDLRLLRPDRDDGGREFAIVSSLTARTVGRASLMAVRVARGCVSPRLREEARLLVGLDEPS
jgi:hypothetical protein